MGRKVAVLILSFFVIYTFNFFIPRLMPGDPFSHSSAVSGEEMAGLSEKELARLKAYYGLDKPIMTQFITTVKNNLQGDFGQSILYKKCDRGNISQTPWTLYIVFATLIISLISGLY